jgi:two-component system CheB/CheR fusion protein
MAKPKRPAKNNAMIVVGIGASAGGLAAYRAFFEKMPPESGMAFVVVQHLDPVHKSEIAELLGRCTEMPVVAASNAMAVEADHVYVIPPNKALSIGHGRLWLSVPAEARGRRLPIDFFFQSLAAEYQERGIGIVLSGTGSDGTLGLGAIKAAGGLTLVQDPISAEHDGMPRSAIGAGAADDVMPVEQMPAALIKYAQHPYIHGAAGAAPLQKGGEDQFLGILSLVRARTKFDFGSYKQGTLRRRVHRRMSLRHITRFSEYMDLLRRDSDEVQALIKDLLISVTHFFRDPEAWKYLQEHAIRPLVRQWTSDDPIRAWVAGCATGEEAYSVAMTLLDELTAVRKPCGVQVFASDVSREAIATARMGIYPESLAAEVSPARLKRYFIQQEGHYRIRGELRDAVVFAEHNLLFDPPFSKLDLITCRNLLIYLDGEAQKKVMPLFHYALCPGGYLFLGSAETVGERQDLFRSVSRKWRIYRRVGPVRPELLPFPIDAGGEPARAAANLDRTGRTPRSRFVEMAQDLILNRYAPASVVINRKHEILYTCGPTQDYLKQPAGVMQTDLLSWAQDILRARLRAALREVHATDKTVKLPDLRVRRRRAIRSASVTIEPLHSPRQADGLILVTFQTPAKARAAGVAAPVQNGGAGGGGEAGTADPNDALVRQLEDELQTTQDDLKGTIEQLEAANEELKASNEEGISSNEELQSSNEELETSKEELQSLNEELSTVNG